MSQFSKDTQAKVLVGVGAVTSLIGLRLSYKVYQHRNQRIARQEGCVGLADITKNLKEAKDQREAARQAEEARQFAIAMDELRNPLSGHKRNAIQNKHKQVMNHIKRLRIESANSAIQKTATARLSPNQLTFRNAQQDVFAAGQAVGEAIYNVSPSERQVNTVASNVTAATLDAASSVYNAYSPSAAAVSSSIRSGAASVGNYAGVMIRGLGQTVATNVGRISPTNSLFSSSSSSSSAGIEMKQLSPRK